MALTKRTEIDKREILVDGIVQVRTATVIEEDGVEISRSFRRHVVVPGDDTSNEDESVKRITDVEHTPERVAAFIAKQNARRNV